MEELGELVARLEREHDALSQRVREREEERRRQLQHETARRDLATGRLSTAERATKAALEETAGLTVRQNTALQRAKDNAGRAWMTRQVSVLACFAVLGVASWPILNLWKLGDAIVTQVVVLVVGLLVIPRRK